MSLLTDLSGLSLAAAAGIVAHADPAAPESTPAEDAAVVLDLFRSGRARWIKGSMYAGPISADVAHLFAGLSGSTPTDQPWLQQFKSAGFAAVVEGFCLLGAAAKVAAVPLMAVDLSIVDKNPRFGGLVRALDVCIREQYAERVSLYPGHFIMSWSTNPSVLLAEAKPPVRTKVGNEAPSGWAVTNFNDHLETRWLDIERVLEKVAAH